MQDQIFWDSINSLYSWVRKERYLGWDPYDGLSGEVSKKIADKRFLNIAMIQLNLYSPVNLRQLLKIKKGKSNKATALFSRAYLNLYQMTCNSSFKIEAKTILKELMSKNISKDMDKFACSSYRFEYVAPRHFLSSSIPDIICVTEAMKSFVTAYEVLKKRKYLKVSLMAKNFLFHDLLDHSPQLGTYFKYTPVEKGKVVFNVSALALEAIGLLMKYDPDNQLQEMGEKVVKFLVEHQGISGAWPYSYYINSGVYYRQIDYHQGFIIDGLVEFLPYIKDRNLKEKTLKAIKRGSEFYMKKQFSPQGWSYYRYPIKYPIDIHNQAQGIITFSKLYRAFNNPKYLNFAERIARWTIENMQDPSGYFYAHKWPGFMNKIPYMRWAQAWMMLALALLLSALEGKRDENPNDWPH